MALAFSRPAAVSGTCTTRPSPLVERRSTRPAADRREIVFEANELFSIPAFILPEPSNIFMALYRGFSSTMYFGHIGTTLLETLIGFAVGCTLAFGLGIAVALSRRTEYFLYPFIVMFQAMPKVALAPLIIVWFGLGLTSKVLNAALVAFFPLRITV